MGKESPLRGEMMKNYAEVLKKFAKILRQNDWPQTLRITPEMYWNVIVASEGEIKPDWRFHPAGEDEGFPYFLIGPTMVRPSKGANSVFVVTFDAETPEEHFVEEWEQNESIQPEFKEKIKQMVENGDLKVVTFIHEQSINDAHLKGEADERVARKKTS